MDDSPRRRPHISRKRGSYKSPHWVDYELDSKEAVERFLIDALKLTWTGKLGTRQASAINGTTRLLMEARGYIQKASLNIIQAQSVMKIDLEKLQKIIDKLNEDEQLVISRAIAKLAELEAGSGT